MKPRKRLQSIDRNLAAGLLLCLLVVFGAGGWAASTEVAEAVVAKGHFVVSSYVKKVQHPYGGVVGEVGIREGQQVKAGAVLLRLDATEDRATLAMIDARIIELSARRARLLTERDGMAEVAFPPELQQGPTPEATTTMATERALFAMRDDARKGRKSQLGERIYQYEMQIAGLKEQILAYDDGIAVLEEEIVQLQRLRGQGAVSVQRLNGLLTTAAGFRADRGAAVAAVAEAAGKIAEMRLQIMQIDQDMRVEASTMLAEVEAALSGLAERRIAATERLQRVNVVAPQGGRVKDLAVHAPGTVITPAETILLIVPDDDELAVDLEIAPQDIDAIVPGQPVRIRMSALDGRITPEIFGTIMRIGADLSIDPRSGHAFYQVRVAIPPEEFTRLGGQALVPGMPVETFIATGARNVLSYLIRPVRDQMNRALRES